MDASDIIVRETDSMTVHIEPLSYMSETLARGLVINATDSMIFFKSNLPSTLKHDIYIHENNYIASNYMITVPFNCSIKLKTDLDDWLGGSTTVTRKMIRYIQRELDKLFKIEASSASKITDYKSYINSPESYMLIPLLLHGTYRKRYGHTPMMLMNDEHDVLKTNVFSTYSFAEILKFTSNNEFGIDNILNPTMVTIKNRRKTYSNLVQLLSTEKKYATELLSWWGVPERPAIR